MSLRAGYEMLLITSAALAPNQATFTSDTTYLNTTGNPFYHGASFGCRILLVSRSWHSACDAHVQGQAHRLPLRRRQSSWTHRLAMQASVPWIGMSRRNLLILLLASSFRTPAICAASRIRLRRYAAEGLATIKQDSLDAVPSRELFDGAMRRHGRRAAQARRCSIRSI